MGEAMIQVKKSEDVLIRGWKLEACAREKLEAN
jgi:hypothetical protein